MTALPPTVAVDVGRGYTKFWTVDALGGPSAGRDTGVVRPLHTAARPCWTPEGPAFAQANFPPPPPCRRRSRSQRPGRSSSAPPGPTRPSAARRIKLDSSLVSSGAD